MPTFQIIREDGEVLGPRHLGRPDWPDGSIIYTGSDGPDLRVVGRIEADDAEHTFEVLVVEEMARSMRRPRVQRVVSPRGDWPR